MLYRLSVFQAQSIVYTVSNLSQVTDIQWRGRGHAYSVFSCVGICTLQVLVLSKNLKCLKCKLTRTWAESKALQESRQHLVFISGSITKEAIYVCYERCIKIAGCRGCYTEIATMISPACWLLSDGQWLCHISVSGSVP